MAGKNKIYIALEVDDKGTAVMKQFAGNTDKAFDKLKKNAKAGTAQAGKMERAWKTSINHMKGHWKAYSAAAGIAMAATAAIIVAASKKAIAAASDLQEVQGKFDVVFEGQRKKAEAWSKALVDSYAMSTRESKEYLSSIQDLLVPMGMAADKAGLMSNEVVKLSADLGSFNNLPTSKVMEDIQSALVGNYETMKKYGVVLNATVVQEKALAMGLAATKDELTAGMKAQASYKLMVDGSTAAIGDMARTSDSYANQTKELGATLENISAAIGDKLLPEVTAWVNQLNIMIKTNPQAIEQIGDFAKNALDLATAMGKVVGFSAEFSNVWVKTWQAMGLASAGVITWKEALTDATAAVERFKKTQAGPIFLKVSWPEKQITESIKAIGKVHVELTKAELKAAKKLAKDKAKAIEDYARESTKIYERLFDDVQKLDLGDYKYKARLLDQRYKNYKEHLTALAKQDSKYAGGVQLLDKWLAGEKEKLHNDWAKKHGTVLDRLEVRWKDYQKEAIDTNKIAYDAISAGAENLHGQISDNLFKALTGDMDKLRWDWDALWKSMARSVTDAVAKMAVEAAIGTAVNWMTAIFAAKGIWDVDKDEQPVIAHKGEMIIPAKIADKIRGGISGSSYGSDFSGLSAKADDIGGRVKQGFMEGTVGTYGKIGAVGAVAALNKTISARQFVSGMIDPNTIAMSAFMGGVPRAAVNAMGLEGKWSDIGQFFGMAGMMATGAPGILAAMVGKPLGAFMCDAIGDALDARSFEKVRDAFEAEMGWFEGRRAFGDWVFSPQNLDWSGFNADMADEYGMTAVNHPYAGRRGGGGSGSWNSRSSTSKTGSFGSPDGTSDGSMMARYGGIFHGPESGYPGPTMHGTEIVIPVKGGKVRAEVEGKGGISPYGADSKELLAEIKKLREDLQAGNYTIASNTNKMYQILDKFDGDGLPPERT